MTAYVVSRVALKPGGALETYRRLAAASIERHGGSYLVRGGEQEVLEGDWAPGTVIVQFPSMDAARAWYASDDYAEALKFRDQALSRDLILVAGTEAPSEASPR
jgi:uncharacterized protein (DUF1330 family)